MASSEKTGEDTCGANSGQGDVDVAPPAHTQRQRGRVEHKLCGFGPQTAVLADLKCSMFSVHDISALAILGCTS